MVFGRGRKKKEPVAPVQEPEIIEVERTSPLSIANYSSPLSTQPAPVAPVAPAPVAPVAPVEAVNGEARVISAELLDNGLYRYGLVTNVKLGEIGQVLAV